LTQQDVLTLSTVVLQTVAQKRHVQTSRNFLYTLWPRLGLPLTSSSTKAVCHARTQKLRFMAMVTKEH